MSEKEVLAELRELNANVRELAGIVSLLVEDSGEKVGRKTFRGGGKAEHTAQEIGGGVTSRDW